ncbi:putative AC transposase [Purpureocillium lavendulum]|uniref:AC transposase n=1 Tax=Purpureocillium lavendulum TaxID=1247861 RepID=A0AB34FF99_9HYPO|nr:putative AC transposase [Purpureocillium lavendulum]
MRLKNTVREWAVRGGSNDAFFWLNDLHGGEQDYTAKTAIKFSWPAVPVTDRFPYTAPVGSLGAKRLRPV